MTKYNPNKMCIPETITEDGITYHFEESTVDFNEAQEAKNEIKKNPSINVRIKTHTMEGKPLYVIYVTKPEYTLFVDPRNYKRPTTCATGKFKNPTRVTQFSKHRR